jgi:hypothetical protein
LLFDVEFTYTWQDAINSSPSMSHYYVNDDNVLNTERPENWLTPVDFRNGTVHVRLEVIDKPPGDQTANWTLCYIANEGGYGCAQTGVYTSEGVFESDVEMTEWWNNDVIDWSQGIRQMDLIYKKSTAGLDHVHFFPELEALLTPTTVRITLVQVSAGDTYDPSALGLDFGGGGSAGGAAGAGGAENQAGAASAGETSVGGSGGAGGDAAGGPGGSGATAGSPTMTEGGSPNTSTPNEIAGAAGYVAMPTAAAGASLVEPVGQAGGMNAAQSQAESTTSADQAGTCAVQGNHRHNLSLAWPFLVLASALVRRHDLRRRAPKRSTRNR